MQARISEGQVLHQFELWMSDPKAGREALLRLPLGGGLGEVAAACVRWHLRNYAAPRVVWITSHVILSRHILAKFEPADLNCLHVIQRDELRNLPANLEPSLVVLDRLAPRAHEMLQQNYLTVFPTSRRLVLSHCEGSAISKHALELAIFAARHTD